MGQRTAAVLQQQEEQSVCRGLVVPSKSTKRVASTLPDVKHYEPWGTGIRSFLIFCSQILMMITDLSFFPSGMQKYCSVLHHILVSQPTECLLLGSLATAG